MSDLPPPQSDFFVVGLGGSAGAIRSFREFFRNVPLDSGMAFVVILHLSPDYESRLAEVLQGSTSLPVTQVHETVKVEPNHVYVIPPNRSLAMQDGSLTVSEITGFEERRAPIDIFFRTLADSHDSRAVCVILSGTGTDGSMGLRRVKEYNGLVFAQAPEEAEFTEMPRNAIATGLVDFILPVSAIPRRLIAYREQLRTMPFGAHLEERTDEDEQALTDIFTHLRVRTGHDFANYKRATVLRRLERRLAVRGIARLTDYARALRENRDEAEALLRELLISVTNFFRDAKVWESLENSIVPKLLAGKGADDHLRVWVPGCATGEEAYSIAMLLADAVSSAPVVPTIQVFATDIDDDAIAKARAGLYTAADVADVPPDRLLRYFLKEQNGYRVRRELRELILFAQHNLLKDPPFSHLDLASCRNLLIYLNRAAQERAMEVLHFALNRGGFLVLGTAESADGASRLFSTVDKEHHIYQSRGAVHALTVTEPHHNTMAELRRPTAAEVEARVEARMRFGALEVHQRLLEAYAAPSLIVDEQYQIVHLSERAGRYLQFTAGEASLNLLQVMRTEMRMDVRTALYQAVQSRSTAATRGILVHDGDRGETVKVVVHPALREGEPPRGLLLVLFETPREAAEVVPAHVTSAEPATRQLEEELVRVKAQMRVTVEQYEVQAEEARAANEELQAINEELRSTAEELETSQEELQSVNEELRTVNQELKIKIDEISHANDDMRNLMSSTDIGTIFVDRALRVKLFTPPVRHIFNLIATDVGRPLLDINSKLRDTSLDGDLELVLEKLQPVEREVETLEGRWHLMRLVPYRTSQDRIDGVVLTFIDITARREAEQVLRRSSEQLEELIGERTSELRRATVMLQAIVDGSPIAIIAVDTNRNVLTWNAAAERMFGMPADEVLGKPLPEVASGSADAQRTLLDAMFGGSAQHSYETLLRRRDGIWLSINISPAPLRGPDGNVYAVMGLLQDITDRKRFEQERERLLRRVVAGQEEERQRIARELHDELGQHLTALKVGLEALHPATDSINAMRNIVAELDRSVDRLTLELRPPALDGVGLDGAITSLVDQFTSSSGIRPDVHTTGTDGRRLPPPVETTLYRVLQEALTNVWKHSGAKSVSIIVERHPEQVQLIVEDDGNGFDATDTGDNGDDNSVHLGLVGMRERVALIGGSFSIESARGKGTTLYVRIPLGGG
ncbi:MAG TPA: CheR family methyltransferase [Thermoanaerobaculia bacterium]|nr:CheR family methyltransferase [Thermoanaerobaculia bacterium]